MASKTQIRRNIRKCESFLLGPGTRAFLFVSVLLFVALAFLPNDESRKSLGLVLFGWIGFGFIGVGALLLLQGTARLMDEQLAGSALSAVVACPFFYAGFAAIHAATVSPLGFFGHA